MIAAPGPHQSCSHCRRVATRVLCQTCHLSAILHVWEEVEAALALQAKAAGGKHQACPQSHILCSIKS